MSQVGIFTDNAPGTIDVVTLTGNSGGAVPPDAAGNINTVGTGSITVVGSPGTNTLTTQLTGLTQYNVLIGAGTATITKVAPGTAGIPLVSTGATSDPAFSTALVVGGGTGNTTFTAYGPIAAGTTATGAFQSLGTGTLGQILVSNGNAALATWQNAGGAVYSITSITVANTPYTVLTTDQIIETDSSGGAITIRLPNAPTTGRLIIVKDFNSSADTNSITVTTVGGTVTIDGNTSMAFSTGYFSRNFVFDGTRYLII